MLVTSRVAAVLSSRMRVAVAVHVHQATKRSLELLAKYFDFQNVQLQPDRVGTRRR